MEWAKADVYELHVFADPENGENVYGWWPKGIKEKFGHDECTVVQYAST